MVETDRFGLNKPEYDDEFWNLPINENFEIIDEALALVSGVNIDQTIVSPSLLNRVLHIQDTAGNDLEIHQAYIPPFISEGLPADNLNGILCGGFWMDRFQACQPAASAVSRGGLTPNSPGAGVGAACKPHVVPWTDVSWTTAKTVLEARGGAANKQAGTCAVYASAVDAKSEFIAASTDHLIGRYIEIVQGGVTYYRRIVKVGVADEAKYVRIYPALPADITTSDTYTIMQHHMAGPYEWFSCLAWAHKFRVKYGLGQPLGNNDWGKDYRDSRSPEYEGLLDPIKPGYSGNDKSRCLTGSGPLSWSLNGRADGIFDLNGNAWELTLQQVVTDGSAMVIAPGFAGAGTDVTISGTSGQRITSLYAPSAPVDARNLAAEMFMPAAVDASGHEAFDLDGCWWNLAANTYAARRGGHWYYTSLYGLSSLALTDTPSGTGNDVAFRGVA